MNPSEAIDRLKRAGMTEKVIAAAVGIRQSTVNRIRHGAMTPSYPVGKALVDMAYTDFTRQEASNANP